MIMPTCPRTAGLHLEATDLAYFDEVVPPGGQHFRVVGPIDPGGGVGLRAATLHLPVKLPGRVLVGALEHQMLEEMGESGSLWALVPAARAKPGLEGKDLSSGVRREENYQSVVEPTPGRHQQITKAMRHLEVDA